VTSNVECYQFSRRGRRITLVDTPGFDDSNVSDREILMKLLGWLKETQEEGQKLSGILYLHRIDAPRMQGSALRNFGTFKQLCGEGFYKNIMLGTTCWDLVDAKTVGEEREAQLKEKGGFWYALLQRGSEIVRIPKGGDSACDLVFRLASKNPTFLKSQVEMGKMGLSLDEVSATKTVNEELEKLRAENERAKRQQQENFSRLQREREERARAKREEERKRHDQLLREQQEERQRILKIQRETQAQREREMKALEEQMRRARIQEAEKRERERKEAQRRLDDQQFSFDYKRLCRAREYKLIKVGIASWLKICGHCARLLENVSYVGEYTFH
jgi:DNA repair exonuclease SbcCD ATPase subunit